MNLLFYSHYFAPSIGGVETIVLSLARGLAEVRTPCGLTEFDLTLVTETPAEDFDDRILPFRVLRQPSFAHLLQMIRSSDIIHVAGPALSPLLLGLLTRKPVVIEHHGFQTICPTGQLLIEPSSTPCPGHFMAGRHRECLRCRSNNNWLALFGDQFGPPTHIKIDVEGYEAAVVRGAKRTLTRWAPLLFLELHNEMIRSEGGDPSCVLDDLAEMGYEMSSVGSVRIERSAILQMPICRLVGKCQQSV